MANFPCCRAFFLAVFFPLHTLGALVIHDFTILALQCQPFLLQWRGGVAPWTLSILNANASAVLENLGSTESTSLDWNVDIAAGTSVIVVVQDSEAETASSSPLTIHPGSTACISSALGGQTSASPSSSSPILSLTSTVTANFSTVSESSTSLFNGTSLTSTSATPTTTIPSSTTQTASAVTTMTSQLPALDTTGGVERTSSSVAIAVIALVLGLVLVGLFLFFLNRWRSRKRTPPIRTQDSEKADAPTSYTA